MAAFNEMLRYLRTREGLSQAELADRLGVAKSTISMYEVGKREPDFETLETIADLFNVDMNFLLGKDSSENDRYYINEKTAQAAQEMYDDPDMRTLFDMKRTMAPDRFAAHIKFMKDLYGKKNPTD